MERNIVKALPDNASVKVQLNGRKRNLIWQALYGKRATGAYRDNPKDAYLVEQIMASMRIIDQRHPVETPEKERQRREKQWSLQEQEKRMRRANQ